MAREGSILDTMVKETRTIASDRRQKSDQKFEERFGVPTDDTLTSLGRNVGLERFDSDTYLGTMEDQAEGRTSVHDKTSRGKSSFHEKTRNFTSTILPARSPSYRGVPVDRWRLSDHIDDVRNAKARPGFADGNEDE